MFFNTQDKSLFPFNRIQILYPGAALLNEKYFSQHMLIECKSWSHKFEIFALVFGHLHKVNKRVKTMYIS